MFMFHKIYDKKFDMYISGLIQNGNWRKIGEGQLT